MIPGFELIVEERIKKSQRRGDFENLEGAGRPLTLIDDSHIPEDLRLPYKILKNAECLPPEVELRRQICQTEDLLEGMQDTSDQYRILKKLNFLIMKLNTTRSGDARFDIPQRYQAALADRLTPSKSAK